jgi:hypothetical protein
MPPFVVFEEAVKGPAIHALVIGVGAYPHLPGGGSPLTPHHDGMGQLTSPPISARRMAAWLIGSLSHRYKRLASVSLLLSESTRKPLNIPREPIRAVYVPIADFENTSKAIKYLFDRCDEHQDNLLIFYFCGHGIAAGTDTALLLADYGADNHNPLRGAIDLRRLRLGMRQSKASEQCYFIDCCRASTDTLLESEGYSGQIVIGGGHRDANLPTLMSPIFYATMNGDKAFAIPDQPTLFTDALLRALNDFAASDEEDDWRIYSTRIPEVLGHLTERCALEIRRRQVPVADDMTKIYLHFLAEPPRALVYVKSEPPDAIQAASLSYRTIGSQSVMAPVEARNRTEWVLELKSGEYSFDANFGKGEPLTITRFVRPLYSRVKFTVPS